MSKGSTLGKNPCVDFFINDFMGGVSGMSKHNIGCYFYLLHAQFNNGHLTIDQVRNVLGNDFAAWQGVLSKKFAQDQDGLFYNVRLDIEIKKKVEYSKGRKKNLDGGSHMGDGNGSLDLEKRKECFKTEVWFFETDYTPEMLHEFYEYWIEANKSGVKMRFEMQKVFEIPKRLAYWARTSKVFNKTDKPEFPNHFDRATYEKLSPEALVRYQQHLRSLGYSPVYGEGNYKTTVKTWVKKQQAA